MENKNAVRLSEQQRRILVWLLKWDNSERYWGVKWKTGTTTRVRDASLSRALRRLEQRGYVKRQNQVSGDDPEYKHRTTHVKLTDAGRELIEGLTKGHVPFVNQSSSSNAAAQATAHRD
jgi:DNA-binding MarR family transcriptional regulator